MGTEAGDSGRPACLVASQIGLVLVSFGRGEQLEEQQQNLMASLKRLRRSVAGLSRRRSWRLVNPCIYLGPILDVIRSAETEARVTEAALSALCKFLRAELFDGRTAHVDEAMHAIVVAVISCRFEVTDSQSEELVLLKILEVLLLCIKSPMGMLLTGEDVLVVVKTCYRVVNQSKTKSELLQHVARQTVQDLISTIFSRYESHSAERQALPFYGSFCMVQVFEFLCSLLNVPDPSSKPEYCLFLEESPSYFALALVNSTLQLAGPSFRSNKGLVNLVKAKLFRRLISIGESSPSATLSLICSIVLSLYHHLRRDVKLQLEAFISRVLITAKFDHQDVAVEAILDLSWQPTFLPEMYTNFDCDLTCSDIFEEIINLFSKCSVAFDSHPSSFNILALEGLLSVIRSAEARLDSSEQGSATSTHLSEPFWALRCEDYSDSRCWSSARRKQKDIKRKLMTAADHFNRDPKKGLEFLKGVGLLPGALDPKGVAYFLKYAVGLDKKVVADYLGDRDAFCCQVLLDFVSTFDFASLSIDAALRTFLQSILLQGESQKIERVMDAFASRYYEQNAEVFGNKDMVFVLSYAVLMLNTDLHNKQVKGKLTEDEFIKNVRTAEKEAGSSSCLSREMLVGIYHSVARDEIRVSGDAEVRMTDTQWLDILLRGAGASPYLFCDSSSPLDCDMSRIMAGPSLAAISVVFEHSESPEVLESCLDGLLALAKVAGFYRFGDILDDLVAALCKFTQISTSLSTEERLVLFASDSRACMATKVLFRIAKEQGAFIRTGWQDIMDCIIRLRKLGLLKAFPGGSGLGEGRVQIRIGAVSGLISKLGKLLLLEEGEEDEHAADVQRALQTVEACQVGDIFTGSNCMQPGALAELVKAITSRARQTRGVKDEEATAFCLELLVTLVENNRHRASVFWKDVYEYVSQLIQGYRVPCKLLRKALLSLLQICQALLPCDGQEISEEEVLGSLQLILKLDFRVADAYCDLITRQVLELVKLKATVIWTPTGWRMIGMLLSVSARHVDAAGDGFEAVRLIRSNLTPQNYGAFIDAAAAFAESRSSGLDTRSKAVGLMEESLSCVIDWSGKGEVSTDDVAEMWIKLSLGLKRLCEIPSEHVRSCALSALDECLSATVAGKFPPQTLDTCFREVVLDLLDNLLDASTRKDYSGIQQSLQRVVQLMAKVFVNFFKPLSRLASFQVTWVSVLGHLDAYVKSQDGGDRSQEEKLLREILLAMHSEDIIVGEDKDAFWEVTWHHVQQIFPSLQPELLKYSRT